MGLGGLKMGLGASGGAWGLCGGFKMGLGFLGGSGELQGGAGGFWGARGSPGPLRPLEFPRPTDAAALGAAGAPSAVHEATQVVGAQEQEDGLSAPQVGGTGGPPRSWPPKDRGGWVRGLGPPQEGYWGVLVPPRCLCSASAPAGAAGIKSGIPQNPRLWGQVWGCGSAVGLAVFMVWGQMWGMFCACCGTRCGAGCAQAVGLDMGLCP